MISGKRLTALPSTSGMMAPAVPGLALAVPRSRPSKSFQLGWIKALLSHLPIVGCRFAQVAQCIRFRSLNFQSFELGEIDMADKGGKKDKGSKEQQKRPKLNPKEKRKAKIEKKAKGG